MRKFQKEQLLDIFTSLHELHRECKDKMGQKEYQTVRTALSDCQEAAIQTGEAIEQLMGEGTEAVTFLEQYCERLYNFSIQLEELPAQKFYKSLEEVLIKAENAVKHMPMRKEVVFFPYKASMWDSLESVYLAAKEDENCDAYCVPIPYYDRRADGGIGQMHYEGNEYPKNIEVIDYRTYNLEERHPDAIYIHNPYDEWNHVTCVPERYFAKNLRNYTEQLVYIPYFVLGEIEPDDQDSIDGMKHFCFTPGVIYAHKVIVQSEKMRQIYINEYIKAAKESGLSGEHTDRKYLEQKILGLGSPKFDKVLNTKKEDLDIPEEWLRIIEKPDGSWKKIIFYNTSINALLQHDEKMLEKMEDVFQIFKDRQDEIALLWRPHPLIKTTIESMRPQLWKKYSQIVEQYCSEGWGIYDDSADVDRAVVLSDVYYGDWSSVVKLYSEKQKRIMIQSVSDKKKLNILKYAYNFAASIDKSHVYLSSPYSNIIFIFDRNLNKIIDYFKVGKDVGDYSISQLLDVGDNIFTIPYHDRNVNKILKSNKKTSTLVIEKRDRGAAYSGCLIENSLWILPMMNSENMYVIDVDTLHMDKFPSVFNEIELQDEFYNEYGHCIFTNLKVVEGKIWFALRQGGDVYCYDTIQIKWSRYSLNIKIVDFVYAKDHFLIVSNEAVIYAWSETGELSIVGEISREKLKYVDKHTFSYILYQDDYVWCLPDFSDTIYVFNIITKEEKYIKIYDNREHVRICNHYQWYEDKLFIFSQEVENIWIVDGKTFEVEIVELSIPKNMGIELIAEKNILSEEHVPIEFLLEWNEKLNENKLCADFGRAIYNKLK